MAQNGEANSILIDCVICDAQLGFSHLQTFAFSPCFSILLSLITKGFIITELNLFAKNIMNSTSNFFFFNSARLGGAVDSSLDLPLSSVIGLACSESIDS